MPFDGTGHLQHGPHADLLMPSLTRAIIRCAAVSGGMTPPPEFAARRWPMWRRTSPPAGARSPASRSSSTCRQPPPATWNSRWCGPSRRRSMTSCPAVTFGSSRRTRARCGRLASSSISRASFSGQHRWWRFSRASFASRRARTFRAVVLLPAKPNNGADTTRGQLGVLAGADNGAGRFLATTISARSGQLTGPLYVHAKIGIVDDAWLTVGSANLNEHSFFNDTEMNVVTCDPRLARETRLRLWSEHLARAPGEGGVRRAGPSRRCAVAPNRRRAARAQKAR